MDRLAFQKISTYETCATHCVQKLQFHRNPRVIYDETLLSSVKTHFHQNSPMILCEIRHGSLISIDFPKLSMNIYDFTHRVQKSQFHRKPPVIYDETLLSSVKTHFYENSPMILCEIRHVSRIFIDFPKSPMNIHDFKRSTSVFIDIFVTSMFTGDQRTQFTCFHPWCDNIDDHRWLSGYITRENQCHQNLQDHPWYPLFVMHDHWLFDVITLKRKLDFCSCGYLPVSTGIRVFPHVSSIRPCQRTCQDVASGAGNGQ